MSTPLPANDLSISSLRVVLRWIQHECAFLEDGSLRKPEDEPKKGAKKDKPSKRKGTSLDVLAILVGLSSRDQLNKFLGGGLNREEEAKRYGQIATGLYPHIGKIKSIPAIIHTALQDVYGQNGRNSDGVIRNPAVVAHKSLVPAFHGIRDTFHPFEGLNVIVRMSSEFVQDPDSAEPDRRVRGWAISLFNLPDQRKQTGVYHPLFMIRQKSAEGNTMRIEGVVIGKADRMILQGLEEIDQRSFAASITLDAEKLYSYRAAPDAGKPPITLSGVMMGLSNKKTHFVGLFEVFAVPGAVSSRKGFDELYEQVKDAIGVYDLHAAIHVLNTLGIKATTEQLEELRDKSLRSPILSAS